MKHTTHGFTIVELLIVIVVIAILAALSYVGYVNIQGRARDAVRVQDIANIKKALLAYDVAHGGVRQTAWTPQYNPNVNGSGGWDRSVDAEWLAFLRTDHGAMPVDPVNTMAPGSTDPQAGSIGHRVYFYYCYPVGTGALLSVANVRLGYHRENGTRVVDDFPVTSCL